MSTGAHQRVTRSASKARSTGAASTGAASVGASSRGRSRRVGSAAPLAEDDKPTVGSQVTRAYGTEGKSARAQLLSAQIGVNQAINPIANAVSKAQAPESPTANTSPRLPALPEEPESSRGVSQPVVDHMFSTIQRRSSSTDSNQSGPPVQPSIDGNQSEPSVQHSFDDHQSEPPAQQSFFSRYFWAPRRGGFNAEGRNRTSNIIIEDSIHSRVNEPDELHFNGFPPQPPAYRFIYPWSPAVLVRDVLLVLIFLIGLLFCYEVKRTPMLGLGNESELSQDFRTASPKIQILHHRVSKVEQRVQDLSFDSISVDATTAKHQVNWFTPGFGTGIDLYLSSPTVSECDPTWTPDGWPWSMFKSQNCPQISLSAPQYAALSPWSDPVDDAWCAPPSNGKLQLTVALSRTIAPTELVVEHAAMDEMPVGFMGSSPREVELWIHIPDDRTRAAVREAITIMDPSLLEDSSPQGKTIGDQALPFDFVPVGRWEYNIWTNQRLQSFLVPLSLVDYGVSTNRVAVRVNSNWGNVKYTCLSRLRLYGEDTSGNTEGLDAAPVGMALSQ